jgi:glycosyltransferase involved in cell wall biosynthesis
MIRIDESALTFQKPKILALFEHFPPSIKAGGPVVSALGFAERLSDTFEISVLTSDRDFKSDVQYKSVLIDTWSEVNGYKVFYSSPKSRFCFKEIVETFKPDFIYINSLFSAWYSVLPLVILKILFRDRFKVILAPRGELAPSAFLKSNFKKVVYLYFYKLFVESGNITYQASSYFEERDILNTLKGRRTHVAMDLRPLSDLQNVREVEIDKNANELRICLIARINQVKNIHWAIRLIKELNNQAITFHIYGFPEQKEYLDECMKDLNAISKSNIEIKDALDSKEVIPCIQRYHLFFFPTLGENFGHSILESFMASRPVVTSDKTPWKNLENSFAGFDVALDPAEVKKKILFFLQMNNEDFIKWRKGARQRAQDYFYDEQMATDYISLFSKS